MISRSRYLAASVVFGMAAVCLCSSAQAQRPALTRSVDEPGRAPYHQFIQGTCTAGTCRFNFKAVPAGFRLVITHVSLLFVTSPGSFAYLSDQPGFNGLAAPDGSTNALALSATKLDASSGLATVSSPVTFFVEPGGTPVITLAASGAPVGSINGYLVGLD